jgi:hypothetical protein
VKYVSSRKPDRATYISISFTSIATPEITAWSKFGLKIGHISGNPCANVLPMSAGCVLPARGAKPSLYIATLCGPLHYVRSVTMETECIPDHLPIKTRSLRICEECKSMKPERHTPRLKRTEVALGPVHRSEEADMICIWKERMPIVGY